MIGADNGLTRRDTWRHLTEEEHRILHTVLRRPPVPGDTATTGDHPTVGQWLADRVTNRIGSWPFIIVQSVILLIWIVVNTIAWRQHWDPYPFILLNLVLSFQAAYAGCTGGGGEGDAFVAKLDPLGATFVYSTYLGGTGCEITANSCGRYASDVAVDATGNAIVIGTTRSTDFPTTAGAFDTSYGGFGDGFVTKFDPLGDIVYSTYLGGATDEDSPNAVTAGGDGWGLGGGIRGWGGVATFPSP